MPEMIDHKKTAFEESGFDNLNDRQKTDRFWKFSELAVTFIVSIIHLADRIILAIQIRPGYK